MRREICDAMVAMEAKEARIEVPRRRKTQSTSSIE